MGACLWNRHSQRSENEPRSDMYPWLTAPTHYAAPTLGPAFPLMLCFTTWCKRCNQNTTQEHQYIHALGSTFRCLRYGCGYYNHAKTPRAIRAISSVMEQFDVSEVKKYRQVEATD